MRRFFAILPLILLAFPLASPAQQQPGANSRRARFSISGTLRQGGDNVSVEGVKVDLRSLTGSTMGSTFTGINGGFEFNSLPSGSYVLVIQQPGFDGVNEQVHVGDASIFGLQIELHRTATGSTDPSHTATVSAHELMAPHKAQEAMAKGMRLLYEKSEFSHSIPEFQRAILAYPSYYEAYAQMGIAYVNMKDIPNAEQAFRKSLELSEGKYVSACFLLAKLLSLTHRYSEAEPVARRGIEIDAQAWQAHEELARSLLGQERADEAEEHAKEAATLQPKEPRLQILLADIHMSQRNYQAMLQNLETYLTLAPNGPFAEKVKETRDKIIQGLAAADATAAPAHP